MSAAVNAGELARMGLKAARAGKKLDRYSPHVRQLVEADGAAARAALVLRISDATIVDSFDELKSACEEVGFDAGVNYLALRLAALCATREPDGSLGAIHVEQLELWRRGLVALAGGRS